MKRLLLCVLVIAAMGPVAGADELFLSSDGVTVTISGGVASGGPAGGVAFGSASSEGYLNTDFNGWDITVISGSNNSPGLVPNAMDLDVQGECVVAACQGTSNVLQVWYSATGYTTAVAANQLQMNASAGSNVGIVNVDKAWSNSDNALFGSFPPPAPGAANLIASGGPGTSAGSGPAESSPYSLTLEETFGDASGSASISEDVNITAVPEPGSLGLLGLGLGLMTVAVFSKRRVLGLES